MPRKMHAQATDNWRSGRHKATRKPFIVNALFWKDRLRAAPYTPAKVSVGIRPDLLRILRMRVPERSSRVYPSFSQVPAAAGKNPLNSAAID
jgi:hypothetical protein